MTDADQMPDDFCPSRDDDWAHPIQAYIDRTGEFPDLPAGVYRISRPLVLTGGGGGSSTGAAAGGPA